MITKREDQPKPAPANGVFIASSESTGQVSLVFYLDYPTLDIRDGSGKETSRQATSLVVMDKATAKVLHDKLAIVLNG